MNLKKLILFVVFSLSFSLCYSQKTEEKNKYRRILKLVESNSWTKYFNKTGESDHDFITGTSSEYTTFLLSNFTNSLSASFAILNDKGSFWEFEINEFELKKSQIKYIKRLVPTYGKNEAKGFSFGISTRNSYNFNLLRSLSRTKLTVGPSIGLSYNFKKDAIYDFKYFRNQNIVELDLGLISRAGYNIGKRFYLEAAVPINIISLRYGTEVFNNPAISTDRGKKFRYTNYFKKKSPEEYFRKFELILSLGYKF